MKKRILLSFSLMLCILSGCNNLFQINDSPQEDFWGSFTHKKTYSYDYFYYAIQTIEKSHDINFVLVTIYDTATDHAVDSFMPARARDFWGICWDRNSYNIWTQSADVGIYCYEYQDGYWVRNEALKLPTYIISRWDENYRNNPELWSTIYISPIDENLSVEK